MARQCRHCENDIEGIHEGHTFESLGKGFVLGAGNPARAKYMTVLEAPGREEIAFVLKPLAGRAFLGDEASVAEELRIRREAYPGLEERFIKIGYPAAAQTGAALQWWLWPRVGISRPEVFLDNTLRCLHPKGKSGAPYPTGENRKAAEKCCRQWDRFEGFRPDVAIVSIHPAAVLREISPLPLVVKDVERLRDYQTQGARPVIFMGGKAAKAFLRYAENVTRWRGSWQHLAKDWVETYRALFEFKAKGKKLKKVVVRPEMMEELACKKWKRYKGKSVPSCTCAPCWAKYDQTQKEKENEKLQSVSSGEGKVG